MTYLRATFVCLIIMSFTTAFAQTSNDQTVYELRTYTTNDGKLADLNARFKDHTIRLFNKHGMESIGYWMPVDKENTLIYIIRHKSMNAAKQNWQNFIDDPDWKIVAEETNRKGAILAVSPESVFMIATDYSLSILK